MEEIILKLGLPVANLACKPLVEKYIIPKLKEIPKQLKGKFEIDSDEFPDLFSDYLEYAYEKNSFINTVIFKNQQKLLDDLYIPLTICMSDNLGKKCIEINKEAYTELKKYNKILLVDMAGMGKSTALKFLFLRAIEQNLGIPIFIEMRTLSSNKGVIDYIVDELQTLIHSSISNEIIQYLIEEGDFIFFFDGYDEISLSEKSNVTENLSRFINKSYKNTFIMSSRDENELSCFGQFQRFMINPLTTEEAFTLIEKYDKNGELSKELIQKLKEDKNLILLKEFLSNPLMVSLLYKAYEYKKTIPYKKHIFYRQVYDALFQDHDLSKGGCFEHEKRSGLDIEDFHKVMRALGYISFFKYRKMTYSKQELMNIINECKEKVPEINFNVSDLLSDILKAVPLLSTIGNEIKWVHKSFQEYFCAAYIALDLNDKSNIIPKIATSDKCSENINVLDFFYDMDYKTFEESVIYPMTCDYLEFYKEQKECLDELLLNDLFIYEDVEIIIKMNIKDELFSYDEERKDIKYKTVSNWGERYRIGAYYWGSGSRYSLLSLLERKQNEVITVENIDGDLWEKIEVMNNFRDLLIKTENMSLKKYITNKNLSRNDLNTFITGYKVAFCYGENIYLSEKNCMKFKEKIEDRLKRANNVDDYDY